MTIVIDSELTLGLFSVNVVTCIISCIGSGIFWNGFFEMPEEYIMVEHAVDRSLSGEQTLCRFV